MAISKSRAPRQIARPRKRMATRKTVRKGITRSAAGTKVHAFIRKAQVSAIVGNAAHIPYQSFSQIRFSNILNSAEFSALYDQYRINWVKLQFFMKVDPSAQTAATAYYPKLYWYRDLDDQTLASPSEMRERSTTKIAVLNPMRPVTIWVKPNLLDLVRSSGAVNTTRPSFGSWIDMSDTSVDYMGIKFNIDILQNVNYTVEVEQTFYFQCKNTR